MVTSTGVTPAPVSLVHLLQGASPDSRIIVVTTPQGFLAITLINGVDLMRLRFEITATSVGLPAATDMHMVPAAASPPSTVVASSRSTGIRPAMLLARAMDQAFYKVIVPQLDSKWLRTSQTYAHHTPIRR